MEWAVAGALGGWAAARLAGADRLRFAEAWAVPLLSFTPQVTAGAWASALLLRGAGPAAATAVAGAALTAAVGPRAVPSRQPPAAGPVLRVLTANLLAGRAGAQAVAELVSRKHADVLFVQELTAQAAARLQRAGLGDAPHRAPVPHAETALYAGSGSPRRTGRVCSRCTWLASRTCRQYMALLDGSGPAPFEGAGWSVGVAPGCGTANLVPAAVTVDLSGISQVTVRAGRIAQVYAARPPPPALPAHAPHRDEDHHKPRLPLAHVHRQQHRLRRRRSRDTAGARARDMTRWTKYVWYRPSRAMSEIILDVPLVLVPWLVMN